MFQTTFIWRPLFLIKGRLYISSLFSFSMILTIHRSLPYSASHLFLSPHLLSTTCTDNIHCLSWTCYFFLRLFIVHLYDMDLAVTKSDQPLCVSVPIRKCHFYFSRILQKFWWGNDTQVTYLSKLKQITLPTAQPLRSKYIYHKQSARLSTVKHTLDLVGFHRSMLYCYFLFFFPSIKQRNLEQRCGIALTARSSFPLIFLQKRF